MPADGFAFVIQNSSNQAQGDSGGSIGYAGITGITDSLAVEFDTYYNVERNDPNANHIAIQSAGIATNDAHHNGSVTLAEASNLPFTIADNQTHTATIQYTLNPPLLSVYLDGATSPIMAAAVDLSSELSLHNGSAWVGFTAGTATYAEDARLLNWQFHPYDTIGAYDPSTGTVYLRGSNTTGFADTTFTLVYGVKGEQPVSGDWTGQGIDTVGLYNPNTGQFLLRNSNTTGSPDISFVFGGPGDEPMAGRWINTATHDGVGIFRPSNGLAYLKNDLSTGYADNQLVIGLPGDQAFPASSDWNGVSIDGVGVYRPLQTAGVPNGIAPMAANMNYNLAYQTCAGCPNAQYSFEQNFSSTAPQNTLSLAGAWAGNTGGVGIYDPSNGLFSLKNALSNGYGDNIFAFGNPHWMPLSGHWGGVVNHGPAPTPTPTNIQYPTFTPSPSPIPSPSQTPTMTGPNCTGYYNGNNLDVFLAPVRGNPALPPLGNGSIVQILGAPSLLITIDQFAIDPTDGTTHWLHVLTQGSTSIGGWVTDTNLTGVSCNYSTLHNSSPFYALPNIPWNAYSFADWPIDPPTVCSRTSTPIGMWGLNKSTNPNLYPPTFIHIGVDFFVPNNQTGISVKSIGHGIVVGIGINGSNGTAPADTFLQNYYKARSQQIWGADQSTEGTGSGYSAGYSVIVRYGWLYVLYGHLAGINVWVGKEVLAGDTIATLGLDPGADRHLHIEIHSYGTTIPNVANHFYNESSPHIHSSGILPVAGNASVDAGPYLYDLVQFLPSPPGLNGNLSTLVATTMLTFSPSGVIIGDAAILNFSTGCSLAYVTYHPHTSPNGKSIYEVNGYRGFAEYFSLPPGYPTLVSPQVMTTPPP